MAPFTFWNASWYFLSANLVKWVLDGKVYPGLSTLIMLLNPQSSTMDSGRMSVTSIFMTESVIIADCWGVQGRFCCTNSCHGALFPSAMEKMIWMISMQEKIFLCNSIYHLDLTYRPIRANVRNHGVPYSLPDRAPLQNIKTNIFAKNIQKSLLAANTA